MFERQEKLRLEEVARLKEHTKQQKGIVFDYYKGKRDSQTGEVNWTVTTKPPYQITDAVALPGQTASPGSAEAVPSQVEAPAAPKRRGRPPKARTA